MCASSTAIFGLFPVRFCCQMNGKSEATGILCNIAVRSLVSKEIPKQVGRDLAAQLRVPAIAMTVRTQRRL